MSVPEFQAFFRPLLEFASDKKEYSVAEARKALAAMMHISDEDLSEMLPSGTQTRFDNRVAWAKSYLIHAKALEATKRAHFKITDRGLQLLKDHPEKITVADLQQFEEFQKFSLSQNENRNNNFQQIEITPEETLQRAYQDIQNEILIQLLEKIKNNTPEFFETLIIDLMIAMGYGGSKKEAGKSIGRSGDEGIDGIINEDRLGLEVIYLQAKRWNGTVGRPEIQKFVGALHGKRAKKGVFITTGSFSKEASEYVKHIDPRIILIDGMKLVSYMFEFNIGVNPVTNYEIKRIDLDYFEEE